ncbi:MAG TPA: thermonuclease family protein [Kofleriaceae bacterium]|jgi:endonuclease YncB( thermonuclease family)|nr:thermonuclease family protein [Kofleriaceae bacterium]
MLRTILLCSLIALVAHADPFGDYKVTRVVDGDTIRVDGLDNSLRLLGIDTEETFKHKAERDAYAAGWSSYVTTVRGSSPHPVKFATPLGEDAKVFAEHWFADVDVVRLERDDPQEIRDRYHRYLAYVLAKKHGTWVCYNVEAVRAGMSPYFPKYGRSRRYHADFVAAEAEAKAAHRGIWAANAQAYPDYAEREAWWAARRDFVEQFRAHAQTDASYVDVTHADAMARLEALAGKPVVVLGTVDKVHVDRVSRVMLGELPLVVFHEDILDASQLAAWQGEFVTASGTPQLYKGHVELVIDRVSQIVRSQVPGITAETKNAAGDRDAR